MASKVAICNYALTKLGASRIISLTDNTESAKACNAIFEETVKCVSAEGAFAATISRQELAQTTTTPAFEYTYEYQLPTNPVCLRVISVNETFPGTIPYRIEGDKLLTNESEIAIRFVGYLTNSELYGPYLTKALIYKLAAELAYQITEKTNLAQFYLSAYEAYMQKLKAYDGMQGSQDRNDYTTLTDVR
jgi:hypothetical protein